MDANLSYCLWGEEGEIGKATLQHSAVGPSSCPWPPWPRVGLLDSRMPLDTQAMSDMSKDGPKNIDGAEEAKKMIKRCPADLAPMGHLKQLLGGSWVVISGVISRVTIVITHIRGGVPPLLSLHSPSLYIVHTEGVCLVPGTKSEHGHWTTQSGKGRSPLSRQLPSMRLGRPF